MYKISISRDGVFAGDGELVNGHIWNCPAVLGRDQSDSDDTYEEIEDAIANDDDQVERPDGVYTWVIEKAVDSED